MHGNINIVTLWTGNVLGIIIILLFLARFNQYSRLLPPSDKTVSSTQTNTQLDNTQINREMNRDDNELKTDNLNDNPDDNPDDNPNLDDIDSGTFGTGGSASSSGGTLNTFTESVRLPSNKLQRNKTSDNDMLYDNVADEKKDYGIEPISPYTVISTLRIIKDTQTPPRQLIFEDETNEQEIQTKMDYIAKFRTDIASLLFTPVCNGFDNIYTLALFFMNSKHIIIDVRHKKKNETTEKSVSNYMTDSLKEIKKKTSKSFLKTFIQKMHKISRKYIIFNGQFTIKTDSKYCKLIKSVPFNANVKAICDLFEYIPIDPINSFFLWLMDSTLFVHNLKITLKEKVEDSGKLDTAEFVKNTSWYNTCFLLKHSKQKPIFIGNPNQPTVQDITVFIVEINQLPVDQQYTISEDSLNMVQHWFRLVQTTIGDDGISLEYAMIDYVYRMDSYIFSE